MRIYQIVITIIYLIVLVLSVLYYFSAPKSKVLGNAVAFLTEVKGQVEYRPKLDSYWYNAIPLQGFFPETFIATGMNSTAIIEFENGKQIVLSPKSQIQISQQSKASDSSFLITVIEGEANELEVDKHKAKRKSPLTSLQRQSSGITQKLEIAFEEVLNISETVSNLSTNFETFMGTNNATVVTPIPHQALIIVTLKPTIAPPSQEPTPTPTLEPTLSPSPVPALSPSPVPALSPSPVHTLFPTKPIPSKPPKIIWPQESADILLEQAGFNQNLVAGIRFKENGGFHFLTEQDLQLKNLGIINVLESEYLQLNLFGNLDPQETVLTSQAKVIFQILQNSVGLNCLIVYNDEEKIYEIYWENKATEKVSSTENLSNILQNIAGYSAVVVSENNNNLFLVGRIPLEKNTKRGSVLCEKNTAEGKKIEVCADLEILEIRGEIIAAREVIEPGKAKYFRSLKGSKVIFSSQ